MEITGKIIAVLPPQGGVSQRTGNQWASQQFVLQTDERFPQKLLFKVFGQDRLTQFAIQMGEQVTVQFSVDAHESNGRWYGENTAYNVFRGQMMQQQPMQQPMQQQAPFPQQGQPMQPPFNSGQPAQGQQGQLPFPPAQ